MHFATALRGEDITALPPYTLASGPLNLGAVVLHISATDSITRVQ